MARVLPLHPASAKEAAQMLKTTLSALTVMAALGGTALVPATAQAHDRHHRETRMYDRTHRDYHAWNGDEDRLYRERLRPHTPQYRAVSQLNKKQQRAHRRGG